jgi:hypothetical protein
MKGLEIDKTYRKRNGSQPETVAGPTRETPSWVWTIQGNWYRQSDGRFIRYLRQANGEWEHVAMEEPSEWDLLVEE